MNSLATFPNSLNRRTSGFCNSTTTVFLEPFLRVLVTYMGLTTCHLPKIRSVAPFPQNLVSVSFCVIYILETTQEFRVQSPQSLGNARFLESLSIENTNVGGTIPTELGSLISLQFLYLDNNDLSGTIPTEIGQCQSLMDLELYNNRLTGDIGPVIDALPRNLEMLGMGVNYLGGTIPGSIGEFKSLRRFMVRSNNIGGSIPSEFGTIPTLEVLDLSSNQFTGTVPTSLASMPSLGKPTLRSSCLYRNVSTSNLVRRCTVVDLRFYDNELTGDLNEFCNIAVQSSQLAVPCRKYL